MQKDFSFPNPLLRFAQGNDVDELVQLVNSAYRGDVSRQGWTTEADLLDGIRTHPEHMAQQINGEKSVMLVLTNSSGYIEGCVYLEDQSPFLYLGMLTVRPGLQARGSGKKLLAVAEDYAQFLGMKGIRMTVISVRHELIDWYQRRGYSATGEKQPFPVEQALGIPRQPLEFIVLEKRLSQ